MSKKDIIKKTVQYIKERMSGESSGHDWWHIYRVYKTAEYIGKKEKADLFVIRLAALLHDVADWKFTGGNDSIGPNLAKKWLKKLKVNNDAIDRVCEIIKEVSFKGVSTKSIPRTEEGMVVQDADRLDAIGAIGIARTFATGAKFNKVIYDPAISPRRYKSAEEYVISTTKKNGTVINHFYEKLLLLKDLMNTKTAKRIAVRRHKFMKEYLVRFLKEWKGWA